MGRISTQKGMFFSPNSSLKVGGVDTDDSLRHNYSALCHQVVTACDSGRTLEEGVRAYREHQQVKVEELQVRSDLMSPFCEVLNNRLGTHERLFIDGLRLTHCMVHFTPSSKPASFTLLTLRTSTYWALCRNHNSLSTDRAR